MRGPSTSGGLEHFGNVWGQGHAKPTCRVRERQWQIPEARLSDKVAVLEPFDSSLEMSAPWTSTVPFRPGWTPPRVTYSVPLMSSKSNFNPSEYKQHTKKGALVGTCPLNHEAVVFKPLDLSSFWKKMPFPPQSYKHSSARQKPLSYRRLRCLCFLSAAWLTWQTNKANSEGNQNITPSVSK